MHKNSGLDTAPVGGNPNPGMGSPMRDRYGNGEEQNEGDMIRVDDAEKVDPGMTKEENV